MCQFNIPFPGNADELVAKAKQAVQKAGGTFDGDSSAGSFAVKTPLGSIEGSYQVQEQQMSMSITKKPIFLSCSRIETELSALLVK